MIFSCHSYNHMLHHLTNFTQYIIRIACIYYYEINSLQSLDRLWAKKEIRIHELRALLLGCINLFERLEEYLLDGSQVIILFGISCTIFTPPYALLRTYQLISESFLPNFIPFVQWYSEYAAFIMAGRICNGFGFFYESNQQAAVLK